MTDSAHYTRWDEVSTEGWVIASTHKTRTGVEVESFWLGRDLGPFHTFGPLSMRPAVFTTKARAERYMNFNAFRVTEQAMRMADALAVSAMEAS